MATSVSASSMKAKIDQYSINNPGLVYLGFDFGNKTASGNFVSTRDYVRTENVEIGSNSATTDNETTITFRYPADDVKEIGRASCRERVL